MLLLFPLHAEIDVLTAGVGQKHRAVVGLAGLGGEQALDLHLSMFEQGGGDLRGERLFPFLNG